MKPNFGTTTDILIRPFQHADADQFVEAVLESLQTVGVYMPWAIPGYSIDNALTWFDACANARDASSAYEFGIFSRSDGQLFGGCGLNQINRHHNFCNLGYWVRESAQRRGVATKAIKLLADFAFGEIKFTRLEIIIAEANIGSERAAQKSGAIYECTARNRIADGSYLLPAKIYSLVPE